MQTSPTAYAGRGRCLARRWLAIATLAAACPAAIAVSPADTPPAHRAAPSPQPTVDTRTLVDWIRASNDNRGLPFVVLDKRRATVSAFDPSGRLLGSAPALLGLARGDDSVPGIGERKIADILPHERTTPAGRFVAEMGVNTNGEDILWVDYDAAVSMHRVRTVKASDRRRERLATPTPDDNRISYGCINVPASFFDGQVKPLFTPRQGIVYVLPDTKAPAAVFGAAFSPSPRTAQR